MLRHELDAKVTSYTASELTCCRLAARELMKSDYDESKIVSILSVDADKIRTFDYELYDWIQEKSNAHVQPDAAEQG